MKGHWLSFHRKGHRFSRLEQSSRFRSKVLKLLEFYNSHDQVFLATLAVWMCHGHGMSLWWDQQTAWFAAHDVHTWFLYISIYILHRSKHDIWLKYNKPHPKLVVLFCCGFSGKMGNRDSKLDGQVTDHCSRGELHKHICVATRKSCALWRVVPTYVMNGNLLKKKQSKFNKKHQWQWFYVYFCFDWKTNNCLFLGAHLRLVSFL